MAKARTRKFGDVVLYFGNGEVPEEFIAPCGFTSLSLAVNIETNTTNVPDCDDPDKPAWLEVDEVSKQMVLSGDGVVAVDADALWNDWIIQGGSKNVRWVKRGDAADGGGYWSGVGYLTTYEETGERGQKWARSVGITLSGEPTWTAVTMPAAPVNTVAPAITGTVEVGEVLTASTGTWNGAPSSYTYQWFHADTGLAISGAETSTYTPVLGDVGKPLFVRVHATNTGGTGVANSTATVAVAS